MNQYYPGPPVATPPRRRNNGCLVAGIVGCGGALLVVIAIFVIIAVAGMRSSTRGTGFDAKATVNERVASDRVGGFNDDDKRLYHLGIAHVVNTHGKIGSLTIGQVIDQERAREQQRASRADQAVDARARADVRMAADTVNEKTGKPLFRGELVEGDRLALKLDANVWDAVSDQDKKIVEQNWGTEWAKIYALYHGGNAADGRWITVDFYDLADRRIYHENFRIVSAARARAGGPVAPSGGPNGPAPYVVLEEWSYPCGGNGAHGARVMLKNHNPRDLPKAWAYYDASIGHDRTKCIQFEAYANEAALRIGTGHHSGPRYTDADTRTEWLNEYMYQFNANNGYEAWIYGIKRYPNGAVDIDKHIVNPGT